VLGPDEFDYRSHRRQSTAHVHLQYAAVGPVIEEKTDLEIFLTERYCLYEVRAGLPLRTEVHHLPWELRKAKATFIRNTIAPVHGLPPLAMKPDLLHFSKVMDVLCFPPATAGT
jgi:uncharacterized protein YqjF (DUF2071 family)